MSGKKSRDRGNNHERDMARRLSEIVPEGEVITARNGRGGAQGGADLCWRLDDGTVRGDVMGWSVECKTTEGLFPTANQWVGWLRQAWRDCRNGSAAVVLYRQHGRSDCWACVTHGDGIVLMPLAVWLRRLGREGER